MKHCEKCGSEMTASPLGEMCPLCLFSEGLDQTTLPLDETAHISGPVFTRTVGGYELLEEVARGGMGIVYKARQSSLGRVVAVKVLSAGEFASAEYVQRFRSEATAAAKLQHPNIVAIHEVGQTQGVQYFSMEYVEGPNLSALVGGKPLPADRTIAILKAVAEAIHYAHEKGILHRDIKPSNVLIDPFGEPRITDFGLAKEMTGDSDLTATGQVLGTPSYMSPEQADKKFGPVTPRSDVYSLGALLYFMLTGRAPFLSGSLHETIRQLVESDPVKPRALNATAPQDLETICLKCLQKDPLRRYGSAAELVAELDRFSAGRPILARPVGPAELIWRWCRRERAAAVLSGAVLVLLVAMAAGGTTAAIRIAAARDAQGRERVHAERTVRQFELRLAEDLLREDRVNPALAHLAHVLRNDPDDWTAGARIASVLTERNIPLLTCDPIRTGGKVTQIVFRPDGQVFATCGDDGQVQLFKTETGEPAGDALRHDHPPFLIQYSPDGGRLVVVADHKEARVWDPSTGREAAPPVVMDAAPGWAAISADGQVMATVADTTVRTWNITTGKPAGPALDLGENAVYLDISPDGSWVVAAGQNPKVTGRIWQVSSGRKLADIALPQAFQIKALWASPDGRRILYADYDGRTVVWDAATGAKVSEAVVPYVVESAVFAADGRRFATGTRENVARVWDTETGRPVSAPLKHATVVSEVQFSADGRLLLTRCWDDTAWVWDLATGERYIEPLHLDKLVTAAALSPDGTRLVTATSDRSTQIWDIRPGRQIPIRFPAGGGGLAAYSRDGSKLATGGQDGVARVWDLPTGVPLTPPMNQGSSLNGLSFSKDETRILTIGFGTGGVVWDASTGAKVTTFGETGSTMDWAEFSPDGKHIAAACRDGAARLFDARDGRLLAPPLAHKDRLWKARFSPDGRRIATASDDHTARVWGIDGRPVTPPLKHDAQVYGVSFSPDGKRVVTASFDLTARVWDAETGAPIGRPLRHHSGLRWAEYSPDGRRILTVSGDSTARIWDAGTMNALTEPLQHGGEVWHAEFSADGRLIWTVSVDQTARLWSAETGQPVTEPLAMQGRVGSGALSPDNRRLAAGQASPGVMQFELPPLSHPPGWLVDLAEALAAERVTEVGFESKAAEGMLKVARLPKGDAMRDEWEAFRQWFFSDRVRRRPGPHAGIGRDEALSLLRGEGDYASVRQVVRLAPDHPEATLNLARMAVLDARAKPEKAGEAPDFERRGLGALPEAEWLRAAMGAVSNRSEVLEEMRAASARYPGDERFHRLHGYAAAQGGRWEEAVAAFDNALALLPAGENPGRRATYAAIRRNALYALGRRREAAASQDAPLNIPARDGRATGNQIDLTDFYNGSLDENWHNFQSTGFTLSSVPKGLIELDGVTFDIRGIVQLGSPASDDLVFGYARRIAGVAAGLRCRRIHFIQSAGWALGVATGVEAARVVVHYADGGEAIIPVVVGEDVDEWWETADHRPTPKRTTLAWRSKMGNGVNCLLYHRVWENPRPDVEVKSLDFVASGASPAPFWIGITAE
jgi:eukaryotic-like serine/threonine-protein kinase